MAANAATAAKAIQAHGETLAARLSDQLHLHDSSTATRILLVIALAVLAHLLIKLSGYFSEWLITTIQQHRDRLRFVAEQPKFATLLRLIANTFTWTVYFVAVGLVLEESGVNLTTYLASASVIGLAISFGSQGLVQDMVIGVTLIFSDAMDVGDMVEVAGAATVVGRVQEIGLRFTKIVNLYDQVVFVPNRTIANVSRFPNGGIFAYADVQIPRTVDESRTVATVTTVAHGMWRQFGALILSEPVIEPAQNSIDGGWAFVRIQFRIWPGQGALVETTFRQQMVSAMKAFDSAYADWQVPVFYRAGRPDAPGPAHA